MFILENSLVFFRHARIF